MRRLLSFILTLVLIFTLLGTFSLSYSADTDGDYTYSLADGKATITRYNGTNSNVTIPSMLGGMPVTKIGTGAFQYNRAVTMVTIPAGVTEIGDYAFSSCYYLNGVTIPNGVKKIGIFAFSSCYLLSSITLPESVTEVGRGFLSTCGNLGTITVDKNNSVYTDENGALLTKDKTSLIAFVNSKLSYEIPETVTYIETMAFAGCSNLSSVTFPSGLKKINYGTFMQSGLTSVYLPKNIETVEEHAFAYCYKLETIEIANDRVKLGNDVFSDSAWMSNQPDGVLYLGDLICGYKGTMPADTELKIKEGVKFIPNYVFNSQTNLVKVVIPDSVTEIDTNAFIYCSNLAQIELPNSIKKMSFLSFTGTKWYNNQPDGPVYLGGFLYGYKGSMPANTTITIKDGTYAILDNAFTFCNTLVSVIAPDSLTQIGPTAFLYCSNLATVKLPDSVHSIGANAFGGTMWSWTFPAGEVYIGKALYLYNGQMPASTTLNIKDGTESITASAFANRTTLVGITLPSSLTEIGDKVFSDCTGLKKIDISEKVTSLGTDVFSGCTELTIRGFKNTPIAKYAKDYGIAFEAIVQKASISGTAKIGETLTAQSSDFPESAVLHYQWKLNGSDVGTDSETCEIKSSFVDAALTVTVSDQYGHSVTAEPVYPTKSTSSTPTKPTAASVGANSVTLTAVNGCEYSKDGTTWQTSNVFEGLLPNTEYTFYARLSETDTAYASEKSEGLVVKTFMYGDGNEDSIVSLRDAMLAFMSVAERVTLTDFQETCLDVDHSGRVDISDAMAIFMFVAGKRESL